MPEQQKASFPVSGNMGSQGEGEPKVERVVPILYTTREAAAFCMISESNWYKLNRLGYVPKPVRIGTMYRWRKMDIVDWVAAGCPKDWNILAGGEINNGA